MAITMQPNEETEETILRYTCTLLAVATLTALALLIANTAWTAAIGCAIPALLSLTATIYLWARRLDDASVIRDIRAQGIGYTPTANEKELIDRARRDDDTGTISYVGPR